MKAVLVLGSNCDNREEHIRQAVLWLDAIGNIIQRSSYYETPDQTGRGDRYGNTVVELEFEGCCNTLNEKIKDYELSSGRDAECRRQHLVPIDIDIVIAEDRVLRERDFKSNYFKKGYSEFGVIENKISS